MRDSLVAPLRGVGPFEGRRPGRGSSAGSLPDWSSTGGPARSGASSPRALSRTRAFPATAALKSGHELRNLKPDRSMVAWGHVPGRLLTPDAGAEHQALHQVKGPGSPGPFPFSGGAESVGGSDWDERRKGHHGPQRSLDSSASPCITGQPGQPGFGSQEQFGPQLWVTDWVTRFSSNRYVFL